VKRRITTLVASGVLALTLFGVAAAGPLEDGRAAYLRPDYASAMRLLRPLAEQGNAVAQLTLGQMYDFGEGVPQDYEQAVAWYRKAADQGNGGAQLLLGQMYESGEGVAQDFVRAHMWFNLAASGSSDSPAQHRSAVEDRFRVEARMTPAQIAEAQRLAREWKQAPPP
jgi:uncharacterized protein